MSSRLAAAAALLAAIAVAAGAFGAHALAARLDGRSLELWRTASQYLGLAALGSLAIAALAGQDAFARGLPGGWLVAAGGFVFALSLYALALGAPRAIGSITPLGGVAMIVGFIWFALAAVRGGS